MSKTMSTVTLSGNGISNGPTDDGALSSKNGNAVEDIVESTTTLPDTDPPTATDYAFDFAEDIYTRVRSGLGCAADWLELERRWLTAKQFAVLHPVLALFTIVTMVMCSIPVFCYAVFAITSVTVLFTAFLLVEGTLLIAALLVLFGALCFVAFLSIGVSSFIALMGYTVLYAQRMSDRLFKEVSSGRPQQTMSDHEEHED